MEIELNSDQGNVSGPQIHHPEMGRTLDRRAFVENHSGGMGSRIEHQHPESDLMGGRDGPLHPDHDTRVSRPATARSAGPNASRTGNDPGSSAGAVCHGQPRGG